jgi:hypothetical protein
MPIIASKRSGDVGKLSGSCARVERDLRREHGKLERLLNS